MSNRLYVGNLPFHATHELITQRFIACGEVKAVDVMLDRDTGRSRGFAFVEMASPAAAEKAISELDGVDFEGRPLRVSIAEERRNDRGPRRGR
jgi:RNA recognition motif-containing protein